VRVPVPRLWLALALVAVAVPGAAQEPADVMRPCRRADLLGSWAVIRFGFAAGAHVDRADPAYRPYQRYVFSADSTAAYAASATPPTVEEDRALAQAPSAMTWGLDDEGRLLRHQVGVTRPDTSQCQVLTRPLRDPRSPVVALPGDVLLTDQGEDARPIARRLLRRLPTE
jgi:hypothetical protein